MIIIKIIIIILITLTKNYCTRVNVKKLGNNINEFHLILKYYLYKNKWSVITMTIKRGDIFYADLSPVVGSEQGGVRPVLIVQNDVGNKHSPTVIAAAITSQKEKSKLPTHIELHAQNCGLSKNSVVLLEQIRTLDKKRLKEKMGNLDKSIMSTINSALSISFGLPNDNT